MRIAIVDNSCDLRFHIKSQSSIENSSGLIKDFNCETFCIENHAAICAEIINHYTSNIDLVARKVFNSDDLHCNIKTLIKELRWCRNNNIKIINLSLGSVSPKDFDKLDNICKRLTMEGVIIVAGVNNDNRYTMPACSKYSIGVYIDKALRNDLYLWDEKRCNFAASGRHILNIKEIGTICTPPYSSFAVPLMVAKVANIIKENPNADLKLVKKKLQQRTKTNKEVKGTLNIRDIEVPVVKIIGNYHTANGLVSSFKKSNYNVLFDSNANEISLTRIVNIHNTYGCDLIILSYDIDTVIIKEDVKVTVGSNIIKVTIIDSNEEKVLRFFRNYRVYRYIKKNLTK